MSFSSGFQTGYGVVTSAMDRRAQMEEQAALRDIATQKPVSYVEEDTAQMEAMAGARKPDGTPYYSISQKADGTRGYTPNFEYEGMPNRPTMPIAVDPKIGTLRQGQADTLQQPQEALAPQAMAAPTRERHRFMGKDYDKAPTEREQLRAKTLAYADVMTARDPKGAMGMRREQSQMDMAEEQHGWKQQDALHVQNERAKVEKREQLWKTRSQELMTILEKEGPKGLARAIGDRFNGEGKLPMMMGVNPQTGSIYLSSNIEGYEGVKDLTVAEAIAIERGFFEVGEGDPIKGVELMMKATQSQSGRTDAAVTRNRQDATTMSGSIDRAQDNTRQDRQVDYNIMSGDRKHALDVDQFGHRKNVDNAQVNIARGGLGLRQQEAIDRRYDANRRYDLDVRNTNIREFTAADLAAHRQVETERAATKAEKTVDDRWAPELARMRREGHDDETVRRTEMEFYNTIGKGVAPPSARDLIASGINPKTGQPWTAADIKAFNKRFPASAVPVPAPVYEHTPDAPKGRSVRGVVQ